MSEYTSYYLYQRYEKRGDQGWIPTYPNTLSIDGDGTMPLVVKEEDDPQCGYVPIIIPQYEWRLVSGYICDECDDRQYRWYTVSTFCDGDNKYAHQKKQYSTDGIIWTDVSPEVTQDVILEYNSEDCTIQYRWVESGTTCIGLDKYQNNILQVSYDYAETWENVNPPEYSASTLIETDSLDCGYIPPIPTLLNGDKWAAYYENGTTFRAQCDRTSAITQGEIPSNGLVSVAVSNCVSEIQEGAFMGTSLQAIRIDNNYCDLYYSVFNGCSDLVSVNIPSMMTYIPQQLFWRCTRLKSVSIPNSVTEISDWAFRNCGITSITIPDSVTDIAMSAFTECYSLTSVTIGSGVIVIWQGAFNRCNNLSSITINATTPPYLRNSTIGVFDNTNNCPIYVPAASVDAYKQHKDWSKYASRIIAII